MSIAVFASVKGAKMVAKKLAKAGDNYQQAVAVSILQKGLQIIADAIPITPRKVGLLRDSAYAVPPVSIRNPQVYIGYAMEYAAAVHERQARHDSPTQWKYLSTPLNKHKQGYSTWIARKAQENYARGTRIGSVSSNLPKSESAAKAKAGKGKGK